jgi:integrase
MPRPRTGTLELRSDGYYLRVTVDVIENGRPKSERRWIPLETLDERTAKRKRDAIVAGINSGAIVADVRREARRVSTIAELATDYVALRRAQGKRMAPEEESYFRLHINPVLGAREPASVTTPDVLRMLETIVANGKAAGTVSHARRILHRFYKWLINTGRAVNNPVREVSTPAARRDQRKRVRPTDDEVIAFLMAPDPKHRLLEMKMLAISSRAAGGMRTVETLRWRWEDIDREGFARCWIPRGKGAEPQELEIPAILAPFLRAWWERHGRPEAGPVFPVTRGTRKGEHRVERGTSFAGRLRRGFLEAGVDRHDLHNDTARTRRCDFHSFRRAFAGAMARANVNAQQSMALTGHSDMRTHARYLVEQFTAVPLAALPTLSADEERVLAQLVDDSAKPATNHRDFARHGRFELPTFGFGGQRSIQLS